MRVSVLIHGVWIELDIDLSGVLALAKLFEVILKILGGTM